MAGPLRHTTPSCHPAPGRPRTHGDRGPWLATPDLLALWQDRKPDIEYIAQYSGARPSAIRERLITAGALPLAMIASGEVPVNDLITVRLPLERVHDAIDTVAKGAAIKVTIEP